MFYSCVHSDLWIIQCANSHSVPEQFPDSKNKLGLQSKRIYQLYGGIIDKFRMSKRSLQPNSTQSFWSHYHFNIVQCIFIWCSRIWRKCRKNAQGKDVAKLFFFNINLHWTTDPTISCTGCIYYVTRCTTATTTCSWGLAIFFYML